MKIAGRCGRKVKWAHNAVDQWEKLPYCTNKIASEILGFKWQIIQYCDLERGSGI